MTSDVVVPGEDHRDEIVQLMRVACNPSPGSVPERAAWLPVEKMRCIAEVERILAAAGARDFRQSRPSCGRGSCSRSRRYRSGTNSIGARPSRTHGRRDRRHVYSP
jgi:hypothetical protein